MTTGGTYIDHVKCEKDPYYNGEDSGKDTISRGVSNSVESSPPNMSDKPYYFDQSFPDNVTSINSTFEVCPICVDDGQVIDSIRWTYSRTKGSAGRGVTTDAVGSSVSQEFRDAFDKFMTTHENGTKCLDEETSPIPTLSEWKRIFLTLLMMSLVLGSTRSSRLALSGGGSHVASGAFIVFDRRLYCSALKWVGPAVILGLAGATAVFGPVSMLDIAGTLCCAPLAAYIIHLVVPQGSTEEGTSQNR
jgi:hypothetical protein